MRKSVVFANRDTVVPNNGQGYFPQDIRRLYNFPGDLNGAGQTIGLLEFSSGYSLRDARAFWQAHGILAPHVRFVSVDGTRNDRGRNPDDEEASLDLQWAGALAPGSQIVVYEANGGETYNEFLQSMIRTLEYVLNDTVHRPSVLSVSYGDAEGDFDVSLLNQVAELVALLDERGVTVCIASGDQGAYGMHDPSGPRSRHADFPASCPAAVAVGGSSLQPDGTETAWTYHGPDNGGATGGGFSSVFPAPAFQHPVIDRYAGPDGSVGRGLPDVAFNADPATGYNIVFQGKVAVVGGTSVSCPVFAAAVALANQRRAQLGLRPVTGLTQLLYTNHATLPFRDITTGNNSYNGVPGYTAGPGWDPCTGFGSLDVSAFIDALASMA